jgi:hypothetical protein
MDTDWEFIIANDDRDELFAEFWYRGEVVGEIYPDVDRRRFELKLYPKSGGSWWTFDLADFQDALRRAAARLEERGYPDPLPPPSGPVPPASGQVPPLSA